MTTTVAIPAQPPEPNSSVNLRSPAGAISAQASADHTAVIEEQPDLRLVIEEDEASGSFIYKTLDRRTGKIIQQFPRDEILRLQEEPAYQPGSVIRTRG